MNRRLALLLIAAGGLLALPFAWPHIREQVAIADLTVMATSQPREEILVSGSIKNRGEPAFSLEALMIEEPGKEPYRRVMSLDAENAFELTLGEPRTGTYRVALQIPNPQANKPAPERWLKAPDLVVGEPSARPQVVSARGYDYQRLSIIAAIGIGIGGALLLICLWPRRMNLP